MINHPNRAKKTANVTMTLQAIRDVPGGPCASGWKKLLTSLGYADGNYDPALVVSLGDVAKSNDAADALWCIRATDWSDNIATRRAVIAGAVLPAVKRASKHAKDERVAEAVGIIERWCAGDDTADLEQARKLARDADAAYATYAYAAAADAAYADGAADAAAAAADAAADAVATTRKAECEQQRQDIITAFPPIALRKAEEQGKR